METKTKPDFKGKPLIEVPSFIPQIGFLEGDFGKDFLKEYKGRVETDYKGNSKLNVLKYDEVVRGSNPFAVVLANKILRQEGLRTTTQADLEKTLKIGWNLRGTYEDTGLVLRSENDSDYSRNIPLAKDIGSRLRARGIKFSSKNPVMIPLTGLELENADNDYGLVFKLRGDAEIYETPILKDGGNFSSKNIDEKTGLPIKLGNGDRTLYTRDSGLSRLCLYVNLNLYSYDGGLDDSSVDGRVVVVSAEGTSPNFNEYLSNLQRLRDEEIAKIQKRYTEAEEVLRGK